MPCDIEKTHQRLPLEGVEESLGPLPKLNPPEKIWLTPERKEYMRRYRQAHKLHFRRCSRRRYQRSKAKWHDYYLRNKSRIKEYNKRYFLTNRDRIIRQTTEYCKKSRKTNPLINLKIRLQRRIWMALKAGYTDAKKSGKTLELIGCSILTCLDHLQSNLKPGMTPSDLFTNRVHLDHVVPCSLFNLMDPEEQMACFNYQNLQPLWAKDNMSKHNTLPSPLPAWLPTPIAERILRRMTKT